jgi:lipid-A-disaccharide synthase
LKYYLIAGEASGDLHGSNLIKELKKLDGNGVFQCWGGDKMSEAGGIVVKDYKELAFMGFLEVIKNLPTILKNINYCKQDISRFKPDVLVLIDYPGFNLRIAEWAHQRGIKVVYYISPQVWAWKESRVKKIKRYVDKMLVILPFEPMFYQRWGYDVEYVGHPLVQVIEDFKKEEAKPVSPNKNIIALLPGSRKQELEIKLPVMLEVAKEFPDYQFVIAQAPGISEDFYRKFYSNQFKNVSTVSDGTYQLLSEATAALVTSGTATLETALFGVPQVVCYKGSDLSYQIAKRLVKIKFISLVNLIMDKEVVKELIQNELTVYNLTRELNYLLHYNDKIQQIKKDYAELKALLSKGGNASEKAAQAIFSAL